MVATVSSADRLERAVHVHDLLDSVYEKGIRFLSYSNPFELLIGVLLSAQTTDRQVNDVTPLLFSCYRTPKELSEALLEDVERIIHSVGFYHAKARHCIQTSRFLYERYDSVVPDSMSALLSFPGIGRKSANVILGALFGRPAIIVDTHFMRVVRRLELVDGKNPTAIESELAALLPEGIQYRFSMIINAHGRFICMARHPMCDQCQLAGLCPSASL